MAHSNTPGLQRFLDRLTARSVLSAEEQQAILDLPGHTGQVEANRDFVDLNEVTEYACLVVSGIAARFGQNAEGGRQITALHIPGDMADLHSVVQPAAGSALQAVSAGTIMRIPHWSIRAAAARHPALAEALWRDCMVDAAILSQWVVNVGRRDAKSRIAHLLCEVAWRFRVEPNVAESFFSFPLTQAQLGDATGLTCVHVNRVLKSLRQDGLVKVGNRMAHIFDWNGLAQVGDFDPTYLQTQIRPEERLRIVQRT
jgi:CRP-like cAMP-binding protein